MHGDMQCESGLLGQQWRQRAETAPHTSDELSNQVIGRCGGAGQRRTPRSDVGDGSPRTLQVQERLLHWVHGPGKGVQAQAVFT